MDLLNLSKEESLNLLDLRKEKVNLLCLEKKPLTNLTSRVGLVLDVSGSMEHLYSKRNNVVQAIVEKIFPLALQFDDNGEMELWIFSNDFKRLENVTKDNFYGYVEREIVNKRGIYGGTNYSPVLKDVYSKYMLEEPANLPNYLIFITDGDNHDKYEASSAILKLSKYPIFIQFVGIGNADFDYLESLDDLEGRFVDNANFFQINNIAKTSDEDLYKKLLKEYPLWLEYKEVKDMINKQTFVENADIFNTKSSNSKKGFLSKLFG